MIAGGLPSGPVGGIVLLFIALSPLIIILCGAQYIYFRWIQAGLGHGQNRGRWVLAVMRKKFLYQGMSDEDICRTACAWCLALCVMFGLAFVGAMISYCGVTA